MSNTQHASVFPGQGLSAEEVLQSKTTHGANTLSLKQDRVLLNVLKEIVLEPMFILLLAACIVYFIAGETEEGIIMLISIFIVAGISIFQEYRSRNAVNALNKLSQSMVTVIRNGKEESISIDEVVVDDLMHMEEGEIIAADAVILEARDLSINESILTGESLAVYKNTGEQIFRGTLVTSGNAYAKVNAVGIQTMFGKIGQSVTEVPVIKTPLQVQIKNFVTKMVWFGAAAFIIVVGINYWQSHAFMQSFMQGLTLAMSVLPEEIPVAFSTFQALGAFRLLKNQIIVKQPQYVETLGAATVICADKTGTLTKNQMHLAAIYSIHDNTSVSTDSGQLTEAQQQVLAYAMWSSETNPFDPMEISIHTLYGKTAAIDLRKEYTQVHEYPIGGTPPMMTHVFQGQSAAYVIAAKGAVERLIRQSKLSPEDQQRIETQSLHYARQGYRVLAVGKGEWANNNWPATQDEIPFSFLGLLAFQDPPKENIVETIRTFHEAGISVKMITGDYKETALAIAKQVGMDADPSNALEGKEILAMSDEALKQKVGKVNIFARMFPEAKLRIINALKDNGEVVAMTGDGVNDAPALKAAHIGISMGKRGSEVAKGAASLILTDDDLSHMTDAVALGRKIYDNLKKAIQYIVSIHIPIILVVTLPLLLGWTFKDIFSPVHVIFLELIMGPTCSIIYENEPMEPGTMQRPPRKMSSTFLSFQQLGISIVQGLAITAACLGIGYWSMQQGHEQTLTRTMIFITLLFSNVFLTLVNRSFTHTIFTTIRYKNNLLPLIIGITLLFITGLLYWSPLQELFSLQILQTRLLLTCVAAAFVATFWLELVKGIRLMQRNPYGCLYLGKDPTNMLRIFIILLLAPLLTEAQLTYAPDPNAFGVSGQRLLRIDSFVQRYIDAGRLNGAVGLIMKDGKVVYHQAMGYSNLASRTPMQKDNIFRIASMTKPIVSAAVMMLWEEGRFSLEDPVSKFIPAFKDAKVLDRFYNNDTSFTTVPAKREITIRHLLNHTSGIGYAQIGSPFANAIYGKYKINGGIGTPSDKLSEVIPRLAKLPLFNQPGEKFLYGLNTDVLGYLIEVVSGKPLDQFLQERIFTPLGMKDTYFYLPANKASRLVPLYKLNNKNKAEPYTAKFDNGGDPNFPLAPGGSYFSGGAGLSSTAYDYALFAQMLLNGGELNGVRLLSPHTIRLMTSNQIGDFLLFDNPTDPRRFGLGFGLLMDKAVSVMPVGYGTYMWDGMFATHFWVDPKHNVVVVFMRNIWPTEDWDFVDRIKPVIYQALVK